MQTITPELAAILKDKFQGGVDGFRGRVDVLTGPGAPFSVVPAAVRVDKSLRLDGDQAEFDVPNEDDVFGWGPDSTFKTNARVRFFQWYGDEANEVRTFTGLIDKVHDHRDVWSLTVTCRDMMALLLDQTFSAIGPQGADETDTVRTEANGVYLNKEVSYIVNDILDRAGWPEDDRAVDMTSNVVEEFVVNDGDSWAETIIGDDKLTALTGYDAWADELGVFHFSLVGFATVSTDTDEPPDPTYVFRSGEDITALDDETDQYDLRTRVKVRGPLVTTTLKDAWTLLWKTTKIKLPVGFWYDPAQPTYIRVLDRGTKRIYKMRQSDRVVVSSVYVGSVASRPLGLSGDPGDSAVYWILNAPWRTGGGTSGNFIKKIRRSDNHVLSTHSLPDGRWTDMKVSSNWIWLTNYDTDKIHRYNKSTGASSASYTITYSSVAQTNPTGIMVDGTDLFYFFANGGSTARFLKVTESAPQTITGVIKTAGTILKGGEMDTTTHTECYGGSDDLGITAKFTLVTPVSTSQDVSLEVIDTDLEDELGDLAQTEDRVHDSHSGDAAHPYEVRRETMNLKLITSLAQAMDAARILLAKIGKRRRVLDAGIIGNPPLQKGDLVGVLDPPTGISTLFFVDTYRTDMTDGAYLGTVALLPLRDVTFVSEDEPTDDGSAVDSTLRTFVFDDTALSGSGWGSLYGGYFWDADLAGSTGFPSGSFDGSKALVVHGGNYAAGDLITFTYVGRSGTDFMHSMRFTDGPGGTNNYAGLLGNPNATALTPGDTFQFEIAVSGSPAPHGIPQLDAGGPDYYFFGEVCCVPNPIHMEWTVEGLK